MTDDLRTRIAAAIKDALFDQPEWQGTVDNGLVADAVIAELRLEIQQVIEQELAAIIHGYVTDWKADDD